MPIAPLWEKSFWWTRTGGLLGILLAILGMWMSSTLSEDIGSCGLPQRLSNPSIAIELAASPAQLRTITGTCEAPACRPNEGRQILDEKGNPVFVCQNKIDALIQEQLYDRGLIGLYWTFFVYLGVLNWRFAYWEKWPVLSAVIGKVGGTVTALAVTGGAYFDWKENNRIVEALSLLTTPGSFTPAMRDFSYLKWRLVFLATGACVPIFLFWTGRSNPTTQRRSLLSDVSARVVVVLALITAVFGVSACNLGDDHRVETAASTFVVLVVLAALTLLTGPGLRGGTMAGLDRLGHSKYLAFLTNLYVEKSSSGQKPNIGPSQIP